MQFISVLPAIAGYFVEHPRDGHWEPVIAWGFDGYGNAPEPITVRGAISRGAMDDLRIKDPTGRVIVV